MERDAPARDLVRGVAGQDQGGIERTPVRDADANANEGADADVENTGLVPGRPAVRPTRTDTPPVIDGRLDDDRHWWPQAEAVVGFLNAYQLTSAPRFLDAALACWTFIENHLVDREGGEWFFRVSRDGTPCASEDKVGPWKGPYHNTRACLEVMTRVEGCCFSGVKC
ncbi:MAG: AGE family epimerase/isomerase [Bacteroidetes bacterium]|nr:AGE family epimerase/isomerase [Bacteroidota bacterium]